ncbi:hypothetical protein ACW5WK_07860 [Aeromonas enteropelogenes]|uniref:hypothetical protein n=1 Tax=Aeromonas enteropelogenes TaxID=29489 RepID=UPI000A58DDAA|nr:hypothetical protein LA341_01540 [Aeromonas enteropelogenes]
MRMHHKAMLAIACTAALSACDSEKAANSIAKRAPMPTSMRRTCSAAMAVRGKTQ